MAKPRREKRAEFFGTKLSHFVKTNTNSNSMASLRDRMVAKAAELKSEDDAFFDAFCTQVDDVLCRATSGDTNLGYIVVTTRHFEPSDRSADECRALKDAWYARNICITESAGGSSALRNIKISFGGEEYSEQSDLPTCKFVRVQQFRVYFPDPR